MRELSHLKIVWRWDTTGMCPHFPSVLPGFCAAIQHVNCTDVPELLLVCTTWLVNVCKTVCWVLRSPWRGLRLCCC
jgi:hypothetical protein